MFTRIRPALIGALAAIALILPGISHARSIPGAALNLPAALVTQTTQQTLQRIILNASLPVVDATGKSVTARIYGHSAVWGNVPSGSFWLQVVGVKESFYGQVTSHRTTPELIEVSVKGKYGTQDTILNIIVNRARKSVFITLTRGEEEVLLVTSGETAAVASTFLATG